ncbi:hypothetical protein SAMN05216582_10140 [Selenomonas ruminantium]|uniref:Uncharacterized protein n=1 Tax=Selenomonas ruminantium TaxID=971 RepID=A0A1M6QXP8_SELRU|nr:hypothetical protein SAMN05216582_10140 [Selenomonas ruminantium]
MKNIVYFTDASFISPKKNLPMAFIDLYTMMIH